MTLDRTSQAIAKALAAQAAAAARSAPPRLAPEIVARIRARSLLRGRTIQLPPPAAVDEEMRMAARDGQEGVSPELEAELRREEEADDADPDRQ